MILHGFGPAWDTIDMSPFVTKLATWLRMAGIPFEQRVGDVRKIPRGKMPAVTLDDGRMLVDSAQIIAQLSASHADPLGDARLSAQQQAQAHAIRALCETELYFATVYLRWVPDASWALYQPQIAGFLRTMGVPGFIAGPLTGVVRKKTREQVVAQGMGRRSAEEVKAIACRCYADLSALLGDQPYMMGEHASEIDATVFAFVHGVLTTPFAVGLKEQIHSLPNLASYHQRMLQRYWPERV